MLSFELLTPGGTAHVGVVADEVSCPVSLPESSEEESSPLSTSIGSPTDGQCQPRDVIYAYSHAVLPAVGLPVLQNVPGG